MKVVEGSTGNSYAADLKKWMQIGAGYDAGKYAYHATMPTDTLARVRDTMLESQQAGFETLRAAQVDLGAKVRALLESRGFPSVAARPFQSPGVVVSHTSDPTIQDGSRFAQVGIQSAAGVPLMCDEPADFSTFRLGLFGLEKLRHVDRTVSALTDALDRMGIAVQRAA